MKLEMTWILPPICALFSQLGGSDYAPKAFRRFGIPLAMGGAWWYFVGWTWLIIPMMLLQWGAFTLPVTLKGDSIPDGGFINWAWLPVKYTLTSCPALVLAPHLWFISVILGLFMATMTTLSNVPATAKYFQWKFVEMLHGMMPSIVLCFAATI